MSSDVGRCKWIESASAWIRDQGEHGDWSRRTVLDPALEPILSDVGGLTVLDLGCGEGRYSRILKERGAIVTGLDPVPQFIERARSLDPESTYVEAAADPVYLISGLALREALTKPTIPTEPCPTNHHPEHLPP